MEQISPDTHHFEILVVDDTPDSLQFLKLTLEKRGYLVRAASDGPLALQSVAAKVPDLILLDVKMPGMDGYEMCRRLKADDHSSNIPVIFISALDEPMDKVRGFKAGGVDYIAKPFEPEEVFARVETHLRLQALTHHLEEQVHQRTQELLAAKEEAEAASIVKSKFLSKMSHELRTPLNPIMGYAQVLKKQKNLTPQQKEQLQIVYESCTQLTKLISDVLEVARIDMCQWTVEKHTFNPQDLIMMVVKDARIKAAKKNLPLHHEESHNLPESVFGDCRMINQVLSHLLDNAVKFTEKGTITLRTSVVPVPMTGAEDQIPGRKWRLRFEVADSGVGIPNEIIDEIFEPFFQGEREGQVIEGAGLGLTLSRRLVELMEGELSVRSPYPQERDRKMGPGSIFTVELDLGALAAQPSASG